jgi:transposase
MERKEYKRYSREFKLEAVRLAALGEKPKAQIARDLGIRVNQLRKWRLDSELEDRTGAQTPASIPGEDLRGLRRENVRLRAGKNSSQSDPALSGPDRFEEHNSVT